MTIPTVESITNSGTSTKSTTQTVSYPASGIAAGDLLLVLYENEDPAQLPTFPGSYATNAIFSEASGFGFVNAASYIEAAGTENGGSFNITTATSEAFAAFLVHIKNWNASAPPEVGARAYVSSINTQAVTIDPAGWGVEDTLWIWWHTTDNAATANPIVTFPSEMPDNRTNYNPGGIDGISLALATDDTVGSSRSVAGQTSNMTAADGHGEMLFAIRGASGGATRVLQDLNSCAVVDGDPIQ